VTGAKDATESLWAAAGRHGRHCSQASAKMAQSGRLLCPAIKRSLLCLGTRKKKIAVWWRRESFLSHGEGSRDDAAAVAADEVC
jgi:hypothetical protein